MRVGIKPFWVFGMVGCFTMLLPSIGQTAETLIPSPPIMVPTSPDGVQRATVILDSYSYSPNHLVVERGKAVELTLTSVTTITPHNFIIKDSAGGLSIEYDVGAGKSVLARFIPTEPGRFPFFCDKRLWPMPSHRDKGMEGVLEVK